VIHSFITVFECKKRIFDNREKLNENQIGIKEIFTKTTVESEKDSKTASLI